MRSGVRRSDEAAPLVIPANAGISQTSSAEQRGQVVAVARLRQRPSALREPLVGQEALPPGGLLGGADLQPLPGLDGADEVARVVQRVEGAGVEPGGAARQDRHLQPAVLQVDAG